MISTLLQCEADGEKKNIIQVWTHTWDTSEVWCSTEQANETLAKM